VEHRDKIQRDAYCCNEPKRKAIRDVPSQDGEEVLIQKVYPVIKKKNPR